MAQIVCLAAMFLISRTYLLFPAFAVVYLLPFIVILCAPGTRLSAFSLVLLSVTSHYAFLAAEPLYGEGWWHDAMGDYQIARLLTTSSSFQVGDVGSTAIAKIYSYFPGLHLLVSTTAKVTDLPILPTWRFLLPAINSVVVMGAILMIMRSASLSSRWADLSAMLLAISASHIDFQGQFVRESYAFPLAILAVACMIRSSGKRAFRKRAFLFMVLLLTLAVTIGHHITSYLFVGICAVIGIPLLIQLGTHSSVSRRSLRVAVLSAAIVASWASFQVLIFSAKSLIPSMIEAFFILWHNFSAAEQVVPLMQGRELFVRALVVGYFTTLGILTFLGALSIRRQRLRHIVAVLYWAGLLFAFTVYSRIFYSGWLSGLAQRTSTYALLGLNVVASFQIDNFLRSRHRTTGKAISMLAVMLLGMGTLAQEHQRTWRGDVQISNPESTYRMAQLMRDKASFSALAFRGSWTEPTLAHDQVMAIVSYADIDKGSYDMLPILSRLKYRGYLLVTENDYVELHPNLIVSNGRLGIQFLEGRSALEKV